jgi:hypothetical protein
MSTYFLATTDGTRFTFPAADEHEALLLARRALRATGKALQYLRAYDGTTSRTLPF